MESVIGLTEAKNNLNKIAVLVNQTGRSITVLKHNRPCITISPAESLPNEETRIAMAEAAEATPYASVQDFLSAVDL